MKKRKPDFGEKLLLLESTWQGTNKELAQELGISESTYYRWRKREQKPDSDKGDFATRSIGIRLGKQKSKSFSFSSDITKQPNIGNVFQVADALQDKGFNISEERFQKALSDGRVAVVLLDESGLFPIERIIIEFNLQSLFRAFRFLSQGDSNALVEVWSLQELEDRT